MFKPDPDAKRLSELTVVTDDVGRAVPAMQMWGFKKTAAQADKGPRNEAHKWTLSAGATISMWLDEKRLEEKKANHKTSRFSDTIVPDGLLSIAPFTVCELTLTSRNDDRIVEGKAVKIVSVKPAGFSLYSCMTDLALLSPNVAHARLTQTKNRDAQPFLEKVCRVVSDLISNCSV